MDYLAYRKMLEERGEINSTEKEKLLKIYLQRPSLPKLQSIRTSLVELKSELNRSDTSTQKRTKTMQILLNKKRSADDEN